MAFERIIEHRIDINLARGVTVRVKVEGSNKLETVPMNRASAMAVDALITLLQSRGSIACDREAGLFTTV